MWAAIVGVVSAMATLAVAEVAALLLAPASSPVLAVGSFIIDIAPPWVKDLTIAWFGTADKLVLLVSIGILLLVLAAAIGLLEYSRPPWGAVGLALVGVVAIVAVTTRAQASAVWAAPTLLGAVAGVAVLRLAMPALRAWVAAEGAERKTSLGERRASVTRRRFLASLTATAGGALLIGVGARAMNATTAAVNTVRAKLSLPAAAKAAPPIPDGASLGVPGLEPIVTPNADFYRIDTALQVPVIDASAWRLRITGMVERELEVTFDELLALPLQESVITLMCVSNEVGGDLIGNAVWLGYPVRDLLRKASPRPGADMVLSRSHDGWTASTPLDVLLDEGRDCLLAVGMNGEPLPLEHGFPARMVVPGLYGYVSATKWVVELRLTRFADETAYWTDRGWSARGPVKTSSRIDVPRPGARIGVGTTAVAGVAWAQHTGISAVEVRIDGGGWAPATLADAISADTWRQWVYQWDAASGDHRIEVRATDATGATQSGTPVPVVPDGAEGYHAVDVRVN